jgi:hypothetical protein
MDPPLSDCPLFHTHPVAGPFRTFCAYLQMMWFTRKQESEDADYMVEVSEFHRNYVMPYKGKPKGCLASEIRALEKSVSFDLPLA